MNILITGANRGLGLEFAKQYSKDTTNRIFACCRNPKDFPISQDNISVHKLDVSSLSDMDSLKQELGDVSIDLLIHNAGVYGDRSSFGAVQVETWINTLQINAIAPLKLSEKLIDNVASSVHKKIVIVTSKMGSIHDNTSGGSYIYRSSKSAVNMVGVSMSHDLRSKNITVLLLHPGWVQTDMGGPNALITTEQSISGMKQVIEESSIEDSGRFFNYDGKSIDW